MFLSKWLKREPKKLPCRECGRADGDRNFVADVCDYCFEFENAKPEPLAESCNDPSCDCSLGRSMIAESMFRQSAEFDTESMSNLFKSQAAKAMDQVPELDLLYLLTASDAREPIEPKQEPHVETHWEVATD